jgi:hypothetical protein
MATPGSWRGLAAALTVVLAAAGAAADDRATLDLSARDAAGAPVTVGLVWSVSRLDGAGVAAPAASDLGVARPRLRLVPGRYGVEARLDRATARAEVTLAASETRSAEVVFAAGRLRLVARLAPDGPPLVDGVSWEIAPSISGAAPIARFGVGRPSLTLDAGAWRVAARAGIVHAETVAAVRAGGTSEVELILGAGRLRLTALRADGAAIDRGLHWRLTRIGGDETVETNDARAFPILPAGRWRIAVDAPGGLTSTIETDLVPGEDRRLDVRLGL